MISVDFCATFYQPEFSPTGLMRLRKLLDRYIARKRPQRIGRNSAHQVIAKGLVIDTAIIMVRRAKMLLDREKNLNSSHTAWHSHTTHLWLSHGNIGLCTAMENSCPCILAIFKWLSRADIYI